MDLDESELMSAGLRMVEILRLQGFVVMREEEVEEMNQSHQALSIEVSQLKSTIDDLQRLISGGSEGSSSLTSQITSVEDRIGRVESLTTSFEPRISFLERKTQSITMEESSQSLIITGVNLHIRNGEGKTWTTNGAGNLIVGYNEGNGNRSGSHNIVIGPCHSFSSHSGIVTGMSNIISGTYAVSITLLSPRFKSISPQSIQSSSGCYCWGRQHGDWSLLYNNCRL